MAELKNELGNIFTVAAQNNFRNTAPIKGFEMTRAYQDVEKNKSVSVALVQVANDQARLSAIRTSLRQNGIRRPDISFSMGIRFSKEGTVTGFTGRPDPEKRIFMTEVVVNPEDEGLIKGGLLVGRHIVAYRLNPKDQEARAFCRVFEPFKKEKGKLKPEAIDPEYLKTLRLPQVPDLMATLKQWVAMLGRDRSGVMQSISPEDLATRPLLLAK